MDDGKHWHYVLGTDKRGPISMESLRELIAAGSVQRGTHVWRPGMSAWMPADAVDELRGEFASAKPVVNPQEVAVKQDSAVATVIPYKNAPALIGYYISIASLIPLIGVLLAIAAIILGSLGLSNVRKHPEVKGTAHSIVAITLGSLVLLGHIALGVLFMLNKP